MDEFEEMLNAVRTAQEAEQVQDADAPPRPQTKSYTHYAPLDRIDLVLATFTTATTNRTFSKTDYETAKAAITKAIQRRQLRPRYVQYLGLLYPELVAQTVLLAETSDWPCYDLDHVLEYMVMEWLQTNPSAQHYLTDLFAIIKREAVYGLTILLLNRSVLHISDDEIVINTTRPTNHPRHGAAKEIIVKKGTPAYSEPVRQQIITFLQKQNCYTTSDTTINKLIQQFSVNKEQALLAKLGYILIRIMSKISKEPRSLKPVLPKLLTQR